VRRAVEGEITGVEQKLTKGPATAEASARTLASLARTLAVLRGLEAEAAEKQDADTTNDADAPPLDIAELRNELARRLDRLHREGGAS
jgi:hypothetical protein